MLRRIAFAVAVFSLTGAAAAPVVLAATATVRIENRYGIQGTVVEYRASPGEANRINVLYEDERIRFRDSGAVITSGPGCVAVTPNEVTCLASAFVFEISVEAGDENDLVTGDECRVPQFCDFLHLDGGDGDDAVTGGQDSDDVVGGEGEDRLDGRAGHNDRLDGGPGADTLVGGPGLFDAVHYTSRTNPVFADLDGLPDDGEAGEGDRIGSGIEQLWGGSADDRLTGDATHNLLIGGLGADILRSGRGNDRVRADELECAGPSGGADVVHGEAGSDLVMGCGGDDTLRLGRGPDNALGGPGDDRLFGGPAQDSLSGGSGRDRLYAHDGNRDDVRGGPERDWACADVGIDLVRAVEASCRASGSRLTGSYRRPA